MRVCLRAIGYVHDDTHRTFPRTPRRRSKPEKLKNFMRDSHVASFEFKKFHDLKLLKKFDLASDLKLKSEDVCQCFTCSQCMPSLAQCGGIGCNRLVCAGCATSCASMACHSLLCNRCENIQSTSCAACHGDYCEACTDICQGACDRRICRRCKTSLWRNRISAVDHGNVVLQPCEEVSLVFRSLFSQLEEVQLSGPSSRPKVWQCVRCKECASTCPECRDLMEAFCVCEECQASIEVLSQEGLSKLLCSDPELKHKIEKMQAQLKKKDFFLPRHSNSSNFIVLTVCSQLCSHDCKECGYEMSTQNVNIPDVGYCAYCDAYRVIECIHCNELERYDMCLQVDE